MNNEIWKDISGFVGLYQVSNLGRVKSIGRYDCMKRYWPERILKTQKTKDGYTRVFVCKDGKIRRFMLARIVAKMFVPNPDGLPQVNHKNENKDDNRAENLEWCTAKQNINYGTCIMRRSVKQGKPVICMTTGKRFFSIGEASRKTGISQTSIIRCCKGRQMSAKGYVFEYE